MTAVENIAKNEVAAVAADERPVVLKVDHVAKSFRLPTEQASGLKMAFLNWTKGIKGYTEQKVLRDISFEVHQGDFFGIVGRNGSGKSTLLKIISQIYVPEQGTVDVRGKLVPFIELGVGFNPELTGRENVYLNGALLGFTREEITAMYDDIVEFAELGEFMDQKLKNYSSGMQVRLAFSVAIKAQGDILVLDEVLAVGDEAFQRKCDNFFSEVKKDPTKTVILVTHSMDSVKKYCNKAILIKNGEIIESGDKDVVADRYTLENMATKKASEKDEPDSFPTGLNARVPFLKVWPVSNQLSDGVEPFRFDVEYEFTEDVPFYLAISLVDTKRGGVVCDSGSVPMQNNGRQRVSFEIPVNAFNNSDFKLLVSLRLDNPEDPNRTDMIAFTNDDNSCFFAVRNSKNKNYALLSDRALQFHQI
ncbi:ABC transporter, ATP-binding protein [Bifidobacterium saguini DSM 23967]|uniref:ABC transporter, ATP-binding protein n=2 Tax=Bifidobacterium saguini TaxID=762210 RepID=A0A087DEE5_9BIFI|nr:ABC transporter ATP-binding protein [Bifidobacterium saguini]KFI93895.1 ABC transporter, ATP-binding protein [Bifidobacterium saguini DSM 23967]QTB90069.1 ABC transporter ATP-binding protein [Bifidobacterium saguini]